MDREQLLTTKQDAQEHDQRELRRAEVEEETRQADLLTAGRMLKVAGQVGGILDHLGVPYPPVFGVPTRTAWVDLEPGSTDEYRAVANLTVEYATQPVEGTGRWVPSTRRLSRRNVYRESEYEYTGLFHSIRVEAGLIKTTSPRYGEVFGHEDDKLQWLQILHNAVNTKHLYPASLRSELNRCFDIRGFVDTGENMETTLGRMEATVATIISVIDLPEPPQI